MCSILENDGQEMVRVREKCITESDMCRKCQTNNAKIILRAKDLYCRPCFLIYFNHKFRSTIGKSREIKPGDKILIGLSGGLSSMALLHLTQLGLDEDTPKKLKIDPSILFIDESVLQREGPSLNIIEQEIQKLNFPFYYTSFEEVLKSESSEMSITSYEESPVSNTDAPNLADADLRDKLNQLLSTHLNNQTSREDMICHLRNELICRCAKQLGFKKVFLGTNGTELSVRILTDIATGRGSQLGDHVQFKARQFGVELFRPMRELMDDEVKHFVQCQNVFIPDQDSYSSNREKAPSIASCTKDFLSGLQREFVSTVPTVFKTGGKLVSGSLGSNYSAMATETAASSSNSLKSFSSGAENSFCGTNSPNLEKDGAIQREDCCLFCGLGKDHSYSAVSAANSIRVSKSLSTGKRFDKVGTEVVAIPSSNNDGALSANGILETSEQRNDHLMEEENLKYFCYGCANLFLEVRNIGNFPPRVRERLKEKRREETTLELIHDCLI